ncbi:hypothetical protein BA6E_1213 [Bacteroidales bacterium 6E]|nr:hypothetical protein BA6E_1213 [Bacteroidales bacterium 6E]
MDICILHGDNRVVDLNPILIFSLFIITYINLKNPHHEESDTQHQAGIL